MKTGPHVFMKLSFADSQYDFSFSGRPEGWGFKQFARIVQAEIDMQQFINRKQNINQAERPKFVPRRAGSKRSEPRSVGSRKK